MQNIGTLTQLAMTEKQLAFADKIADGLGYQGRTAYSTTSAINGLHCMKGRDSQKEGCIVLTQEMGFVFVSTLDDLGLHDLADEENEVLTKDKN